MIMKSFVLSSFLYVFFICVNFDFCASVCPSRCICFRTTVRCMFLQIKHVPKVPSDTTVLDLRFNKIRRIPPGIFQHLSNLNTLLLNNNHILKIENGAFDGLTKLRYLYLYKNKIKEIDSGSFKDLKALEQLYLHFNDIHELKIDTFSNLPSLQRLFLHNNKLKQIPRGAIANLPPATRLRLDSNPLICDCSIVWLLELKQLHNRTMQASATCNQPPSLRGKPFSLLRLQDFNCRIPRITEEPLDVDASFGSTVYFSCKADGYPQPEITWIHNDNEIKPHQVHDERMMVLDDGTLMIATTKDSDEGTYECMAKNVAGEAKSRKALMSYHLEKVAPKFVETPISHSVILGHSVIFPCTVTGSPHPKIRWSRNGVVLGNNPHHNIFSNGTLLINDVSESDVGDYECFASNSIGHIGTTVKLIINGPPIRKSIPQHVTVNEGREAVLKCPIGGIPVPTIKWRNEGSEITPNRRFSLSADEILLTISNVQASDTGTYECFARNGFGTASESMQLSLIKKSSPSIVNSPHDLTATFGSNVQLNCRAGGNPNPDITWKKNGNEILTNDDKHFYDLKGNLFVYNVTKRDAGIYECAADNSNGFAATSIHLAITDQHLSNSIPTNSILPSVTRARRVINQSVNNTLQRLISQQGSPSRLLQLFRYPPQGKARLIAEAAEVYEHALTLVKADLEEFLKRKLSDESYLSYLSPLQLERIASLSGCTQHRDVERCDKNLCFNLQFRTFDGTCNNLQQSLWGASLVPFQRVMPPIYENRYNTPIGWSKTKLYYGHRKPSPRLVSSNILSSGTITDDDKYTHMLMQWGQFLDHDLDHALESISSQGFSDELSCELSCEQAHPCFPIDIPRGDPRIRRSRCMTFKRSSAICGSGRTSVFFNAVVQREQANSITSYIDASNIYGSDEENANHLRNLTTDHGLLRHGSIIPGQKPLLPFNDILPVDCRRDTSASNIGCFAAGDLRVNEQLGLISMHTIWLREHNRIATNLREYNPHWSGETIYQTARKIVGAQMQHITYKYWLPKVLGNKGMERLGSYGGYNSEINPTIMNVFATAAFRFGHSLINPVLQRLNSSFKEIPQGHVPLNEAFFAPHKIIEEGGVDPLLRGLFAGPAKLKAASQLVSSVLTERLFEATNDVALDLSAINIQRGRDHALPEYNKWRKYCNLSEAETFEDFFNEISDRSILRKLQEVYGHPGNMDLFVGGMLENPVGDGKIGPTFLCILTEQFKKLRDGDRFWYENPSTFTQEQLREIKKSSLSSVICDNSDNINQVTRDLFVMPSKQSPHYTHCNNIPRIDLSMWMQCTFKNSEGGCSGGACGQHELISSQRRTRRSINNEPQSNSKLSDLTEDRIESLENIIQELHKTVKRLGRRVSHLEKKNHILRRSKRNLCFDDKGAKKLRGQKWFSSSCRVCECKAKKRESIVHCMDIKCPKLTCKNPIHSGECCPKC